jgi:hypothetical protein
VHRVHRLIAVAVAASIPFLGLTGVGQAQSAAEITGDIQAVDCQSGTVTLDNVDGNGYGQDIVYASDTTQVSVEDSGVQFCTLDGYIGSPVTAWVVPYGSDFYATQIDVTGPAYVLPAAQQAIAPLPILGTVLGTILLSGLLYLVADNANSYYLYPYYGAYYNHYHQAWYRPYRGYYPASAPIISVAEPIAGTVLGYVTINNYQYLAVRDRDGQFRRYPYYGPYRTYYTQQYHEAWHPYSGGYANTVVRAPVAQGDPHWDAPRYTMQQISHTVTSRPTPWSAPHRVGMPAPAAQPRPAVQQAQPRPQRTPLQQPQPQTTRPQQLQQQPTYQRPQPQPQAQPQYQRPQLQQPQEQPRTQPANQRPQFHPQPQGQPAYQPQLQQPQPVYQRPQLQQPQPQPAYQRPQVQPQPQPTYQRPQVQPQPQPTYQRPQVQPQPQPTYQRPQVQQPQRPQFQQQPQPQPQYQRPQVQQPQRPQFQQQPQPQPQYQRPQVQQQAPARQDNGGGGRGRQQCDPRSNQQCSNNNR